jgi:hypothetical protein
MKKLIWLRLSPVAMKRIFFFSLILFLACFSRAALAANLDVNPVSGTFDVGDRVVIKVMVSTRSPINAVSGVLSIPTSIFTIESVSKSGSVLNFWVTEPNFSKGAGVLSFEGVSLDGFPGGTKTVITATLRAVAAGTGTVSFKSGQILANDGAGTDVTDLLTGATFSVKEAAVAPKTEKLQEPSPEPVETQPAPTLTPPEIMIGTKYGASAINGISHYPKAQVLLTFVSPDGVKIFMIGTSDEDGSFSILIPSSLKRDTYSVSAVMIKDDKTNSETSNTITVKVGSIFSDMDKETALLILLLIIAIIYLILRTHVHFSKDSSGTISKHALGDASKVVHKSFDILREDVNEYGNEKMTITERKRMSDIKKDIADAEKIIEKKIEDL